MASSVPTKAARSKTFDTGTYRLPSLHRGQRIGHFLTRALLNFELEGVENIPATGAVIVAGNHTGFLDGPLVMVWAPRPVRTLTKIEIFRAMGGIVGTYMCRIGQLPIIREIPDRTAMATALAELQAGGAIGVFPEGTRGAGDLSEVKDGIGYLAARSGAQIVPVACIGSQQALPKGAKWPSKKVTVRLVFGAPFEPEIPGDPLARSTATALAESIRVRLQAHLLDVQSRLQMRENDQ